MDFGCITPLYIYRMWGGRVSMEEIEAGLQELRRQKPEKPYLAVRSGIFF
jgi:hypothetical protein